MEDVGFSNTFVRFHSSRNSMTLNFSSSGSCLVYGPSVARMLCRYMYMYDFSCAVQSIPSPLRSERRTPAMLK